MCINFPVVLLAHMLLVDGLLNCNLGSNSAYLWEI
jgi:hypothetical protein